MYTFKDIPWFWYMGHTHEICFHLYKAKTCVCVDCQPTSDSTAKCEFQYLKESKKYIVVYLQGHSMRYLHQDTKMRHCSWVRRWLTMAETFTHTQLFALYKWKQISWVCPMYQKLVTTIKLWKLRFAVHL